MGTLSHLLLVPSSTKICIEYLPSYTVLKSTVAIRNHTAHRPTHNNSIYCRKNWALGVSFFFLHTLRYCRFSQKSMIFSSLETLLKGFLLHLHERLKIKEI